MKIDYKKELEKAAKNMILVHDPQTLIAMIVRLMVQKVGAIHTGILLHDEDKRSYILCVSRGNKGVKIPSGFARMNYDNALIRLFREKNRNIRGVTDVLIQIELKRLLKRGMEPSRRKLLEEVLRQMETLDVTACIPSYFRDELLGILFLGKKKNGRGFLRKELDFFVALASDVAMAIRNAQLFKQLQDELNKRQQLFINTTIALAAAIEAKDHYTAGHTERVTDLSLQIAKKLKKDNRWGIDDKFLEHLHIAALLHDIGKIGIPEFILNKEGPLVEEEWQKMRLHPLIGAHILEPIKELSNVISAIKYHHERFDGGGYPEGLKRNDIPLIAAIITVADSYDAMASDRPYRQARSKEEIIAEIQRLSGQQFHPQVVDALFQVLQGE